MNNLMPHNQFPLQNLQQQPLSQQYNQSMMPNQGNIKIYIKA